MALALPVAAAPPLPRVSRQAVLAVAAAASLMVHLLLLAALAPRGRVDVPAVPPAAIALDLRPYPPLRARPLNEASAAATQAADLPPTAIRAPAPDAPPAAAEVPPLPVEPAPGRPLAPGRVIPRSWRERCGLAADGPVSPAELAACERAIVEAAAPPPAPGRSGGTDHAASFAAQGERRLARYEYLRAPARPGGANAGPSDQPGGNYGMGDIDRSVITLTRRPLGGD